MSRLDPYLLAAVDAFHDVWPRRRPSRAMLEAAKVISHRGERPHRNIIENSFAAFDPLPNRVWALECDIRFSRDGQPMVFHDVDLQRIYSCRERLCDLDQHEIQQRFPQIPSLLQLVQRYAGKLHFMLEFKAEPRSDPDAQLKTVQHALQGLQAQRDFHLMALDIETLSWLGKIWPQACVPIARHNVAEMSAYAVQSGCAGMTGHYALLRHSAIQFHLQHDQWSGLGFPASRNCLRYCLNQGASHLFSNHALALQAELEREKSASKA